MSLTGHPAGDVWVEEYSYGIGPPTGLLLLRYSPGAWPVHFPDARDDYRHQLFWSPDGMLGVRRGGSTRHLARDEGFWVRRGASVEVTGCEQRSVVLLCLRQVPPGLHGLAVGTVRLTSQAREAVLGLCRPEVDEDRAWAARGRLLDGLVDPRPLEARVAGSGLARQVAAWMLADPADPTELGEWAARLHTSTKTLQRDFVREYGVPWSTWRTRMRLEASLALLGRLPVCDVAHRVGYASPSSYVAAFRREYGVTPGRRRG